MNQANAHEPGKCPRTRQSCLRTRQMPTKQTNLPQNQANANELGKCLIRGQILPPTGAIKVYVHYERKVEGLRV